VVGEPRQKMRWISSRALADGWLGAGGSGQRAIDVVEDARKLRNESAQGRRHIAFRVALDAGTRAVASAVISWPAARRVRCASAERWRSASWRSSWATYVRACPRPARRTHLDQHQRRSWTATGIVRELVTHGGVPYG
jgi:hypothetical protein